LNFGRFFFFGLSDTRTCLRAPFLTFTVPMLRSIAALGPSDALVPSRKYAPAGTVRLKRPPLTRSAATIAKVWGDTARTVATPWPLAGSFTPVSDPEMVDADATADPLTVAATARATPRAAAREVTARPYSFRA
jgi:hypothetical protein